MFEMRDVGDVGCSGRGMFGMWDVGDVGSSGSGMFGYGMFGMWGVRGTGCSGCGIFGIWDVECGMFAGMWNVDLQNAVLRKNPTAKCIFEVITTKKRNLHLIQRTKYNKFLQRIC